MTIVQLRLTALAMLVGIGLLIGWPAAAGAAILGLTLILVCLGFEGERGERIWLWLTIGAWALMIIWTFGPGPGPWPRLD